MAIQVLLQQVGPLPININFQAPGDSPMYIEVQGSVWTTTANSMIGIDIALDGQVIGTATVFSNTPSTHRTVVAAYVPVKLTQGQHQLTLSAKGGSQTTSDFNDNYIAVIHY